MKRRGLENYEINVLKKERQITRTVYFVFAYQIKVPFSGVHDL